MGGYWASNGRLAELDVPAKDNSSHCSSANSHCVQVFARRVLGGGGGGNLVDHSAMPVSLLQIGPQLPP